MTGDGPNYDSLNQEERREKAALLAQDLEALHNPPERLKDDIAELMGKDGFEEALSSLEQDTGHRLVIRYEDRE